jgi:hypothetical protein
MDVVISSSWRTSTTTLLLDAKGDSPLVIPTKTIRDAFVRKHGRFEVTLSKDGESWLVELTSTGRLRGPKQTIYSERHQIARHAAWDFMARVIRATDDEQEGISAGRQAAAWLRERDTSVC